MTTFTMRLHTILGVDSPDDADASLIGLDRYPIWDEGYRGELNQKIVMRFWNREIGHETVGMFVHAVRRKMGEIMPYYSQLAETVTWEFDPFETINVEHTADSSSDTTGNTVGESSATGKTTGETQATSDTTGESTSEESSTSKQDSGSESVSRTVSSDHPQTRLNNYEDYATTSQDGESKSVNESSATSQGESTQSDSQNTTQDQSTTQDTTQDQTDQQETTQHQQQSNVQTSRGTQGNKSEMLEQYRATLIGVDTMILDELETLFMGVWDTDHSYTTMGSYPLYLF